MDETEVVLLVGSSAAELDLYSRAFEHAGFPESLKAVRSPAEAADYLSTSKSPADRKFRPFPGLILLDPKLGTAPLLGFVKSLRASKATEHLPVVALVDRPPSPQVRKLLRMGADSCVPRPRRLPDLARFVTLLMACRTVRAGTRGAPR